ncbi:hypothetical protein [Xanthomonas sacchari]|uniref:hypothetical protein n=1 Tax=Xanthomonas sacchari TaxID=56458 RepID=UPI0011101C00|nr:hypothetical protein [Xanthomonas sacchari]MDV0437665.1 hypothetical protein [Xanthomonas sacchari]
MAGFFGDGGQPPVPLPLQNARQFTLFWIAIQLSHEMTTTPRRVHHGEGGDGHGSVPKSRQSARRVQPAPG